MLVSLVTLLLLCFSLKLKDLFKSIVSFPFTLVSTDPTATEPAPTPPDATQDQINNAVQFRVYDFQSSQVRFSKFVNTAIVLWVIQYNFH